MISERTYLKLKEKMWWINELKAIPLTKDDYILVSRIMSKIKEYERKKMLDKPSRIQRTNQNEQ